MLKVIASIAGDIAEKALIAGVNTAADVVDWTAKQVRQARRDYEAGKLRAEKARRAKRL